MRKLRYIQAVSEGLKQEMERDARIFVMGEDVRHSLRKITHGFQEIFGPERIVDAPISEAGFSGICTGAAVTGLRPVVEFQISEFVFLAFDQLVNQAQKMRYMSGGKVKVPVTYLIVGAGARGGMAGQHSDNPYPFLLHAGMKTVIPSNPYDAKGLLVSSIRDDDPVAVFLPINCMGLKGDVPEETYEIPLGKAEIKRKGTDVTVVAVGHLVEPALAEAEKLATQGISLEVFDPRSLLPFDRKLLKESVGKTGRVVVFDDSNRTCGYAAEIAAIVAEECFEMLKAPVTRVTRADVPVPFSRPLELAVLPDAAKLSRAVHSVLETKRPRKDEGDPRR